MNWKGEGKEQSWPNLRYPAFAWRDRGKRQQASVRIADLRTRATQETQNLLLSEVLFYLPV
jgi:hypothetical protein